MSVALEVDRVRVAFGGLTAVNDVSFTVDSGELVALIGPNGAGKTAMLNAISGIYRPASGDVRLEGKSLRGMAVHHIAVAGIGRAFQHAELFAGLTVVDNLMVGRHRQLRSNVFAQAAFFGSYRRREIAQRAVVEDIIDFFELERYRHRPVDSLPFGVQKVVGVARALCMEPRVLLLDEPSSGLTRQEKEDFARFMLRIHHDRGLPMLWVEHDMQMVMDLADRLVVLDYGTKIADGTPEEVTQDPAVRLAYLGIGDEAVPAPRPALT
ncbi:MAG: Amino acid/amide transporter ATP-binding protein 1, family [Frankiales bacterium]|jgi:branched-chain amino acid transport system ATP-binding protein|nr:Amino acid/amide transporter ATP-binding protein 1, family [Frankiales bacterium]